MALDGFTPLRGTQVRTAAKPVLITTRMAAHGRARAFGDMGWKGFTGRVPGCCAQGT